MSAFDDAQRFLWLESGDDPKELLRALVGEYQRLRATCRPSTSIEAVQYGMQITRLEAELAEAVKGLRAVKGELVRAYDELAALHRAQSQTRVIPTSSGGSSVAMSSTEDMSKPGNQPILAIDVFGDPDFIPCRDERCPELELHPQHKVTGVGRGPRKRKQTNA